MGEWGGSLFEEEAVGGPAYSTSPWRTVTS